MAKLNMSGMYREIVQNERTGKLMANTDILEAGSAVVFYMDYKKKMDPIFHRGSNK